MNRAMVFALAAAVGVHSTALAQTPATARLTGRVFMEATLRPIADAEVSLPELARTVRSDEKGNFVMNDIPAGSYTLWVRRLGFARYESRIDLKSGKTDDRAIVLPAVTVLDSARVVGEVNVPLSFLEHKAVGAGHFLTREQLKAQENIGLPNIIAQMPSAGLVRGRSGQGWILSKRYTVPLDAAVRASQGGAKPRNTAGNDLYYPEEEEVRAGLRNGCYARVYLDGQLLNSTTPAEPVNLNDFSPRSIEAIEYYAGPAEVPIKYSRLNSNCGVIVLHSRRTP